MTELLQQIAFREPVLERVESSTAAADEFAALVERQSRFVFRVAYSVLRNVADAEDVVQETFLKLYRSGRWRGVDDEKAFLARAAWRMAADRRPKASNVAPDPELASPGENPEQAAIAGDWNAAVHRLVDALPEELRRPLALSTLEELTSEEIAGIMGIPQGTVRSRLSRAREILRQKLSALMGDPHGKRSPSD
jgi:RNA polymerase sigma-70 factor (ECF subfamily)